MPSTTTERGDTAGDVEVLISPGGGDFASELARLSERSCLPPFSDAALRFLKDVSRTILLDRGMIRHPEMMAMAHSLRPVEIEAMRRRFESRNSGRVRRGVGLAFHVPPTNVYTLIAYSWFLSLLAGNPNVVRVSRRRGEAAVRLVDLLAGLLARPEHAAVSERSLVVSYDRIDAVTEAISRRARLRIVWGGDATVERLRAVPLAPLARELVFADRFSLAALSAPAVAGVGEESGRRLAHDFVNDAFWFDQQACSSPRALVWIGTDGEAEEARGRFWPLVEDRLEATGWELQPAAMMERMTAVHALIARGVVGRVEGDLSARRAVRFAVAGLDRAARTQHPGGGVFFETTVPTLEALDPILVASDQTLTVWGFGEPELDSWAVARRGHGIDRIAPIGSALHFDSIWDGQDLFDPLTREVALFRGAG